MESTRINRPREFYRLLKSTPASCAAPVDLLWHHYSQLLYTAGADIPQEQMADCTGVDRCLFTGDDVREGLRRLKNNKSNGNSFVTSELLKYFSQADSFVDCLVLLFN